MSTRLNRTFLRHKYISLWTSVLQCNWEQIGVLFVYKSLLLHWIFPSFKVFLTLLISMVDKFFDFLKWMDNKHFLPGTILHRSLVNILYRPIALCKIWCYRSSGYTLKRSHIIKSLTFTTQTHCRCLSLVFWW